MNPHGDAGAGGPDRPQLLQMGGHCQVNWLPRVQATPLSIQTWFY